jgi:hypothetical protein
MEFRSFEANEAAIAQNRVLELIGEVLKVVADILILQTDRLAKEFDRPVCQFLEGDHYNHFYHSSASDSQASFGTESVARSDSFPEGTQQMQHE